MSALLGGTECCSRRDAQRKGPEKEPPLQTLSRTLTEVGKQHSLTRERIRQIEKHALVELKKLARDTGFESTA